MASDLSIWLYNRGVVSLIGTVLPAHWFGPKPPAVDTLAPADEPLKLEIVAHCWQYAHLLAYQLQSLVEHTPDAVQLQYTLYYCEEDTKTVELIRHYDNKAVDRIMWNWCPIARTELMRRAIGRNRSALSTTANWIWFADCDLIFHEGCLASLAQAVPDSRARMVFPSSEQITDLLPSTDPMVNVDPLENPEPAIDRARFSTGTIEKAKGAFQIVHGDVARQCGYCPQLRPYQRPTPHWRKTFEDTAFRKLIQDQGTPVAITGLHRIRHQAKGRYRQGGFLSRLRGLIRTLRGA